MADTGSGGIVEAPKERKDFVITLQSLDGSSDVFAHLQENEDATQPPSLVNVSKQPRSQSTPPRASQDEEVHIIISTGSGHKRASHFFSEVVSPILEALGTKNITTHTTTSESSILDLTRDIFFPKADRSTLLRIILLSGDGGVVDLVNGLSSQKQSPHYIAPQVVLLPLGTANALCHSINAGKKGKNTWGIDVLASGEAKPLPVFTAIFSPGATLLVDEARAEEDLPKNDKDESVLHGAVVCSWGMHATLVADSDTTEYRKHGINRFKMAAKDALYPSDGATPHAYKGRVSILKGSNWTPLPEDQHMYVLSTLVSNLEAPFTISPASKPLDGSMHLVHFGPTTGDEAMRIMGLAYQSGKHVNEEKVRYEEIEGLRIDFQEQEDRWRRVCVDGKIVRVEEEGWVEVRKSTESVLDVVVAE